MKKSDDDYNKYTLTKAEKKRLDNWLRKHEPQRKDTRNAYKKAVNN